MSWVSYLSRVEQVIDRAESALAAGHLLQAASTLDDFERDRPALPPLESAEADRARAAIGRLAELDDAIQQSLRRLETEIALLGRARAVPTGAQYVDTTA
jgi:hypothetical protein